MTQQHRSRITILILHLVLRVTTQINGWIRFIVHLARQNYNMVRYNNASVLRRLDLDNVDKLKIIMNILLSALEAHSTEIPDAYTTDVVLHWWEREWIKTILKAVDRNTDYPLLKGAIVRFCAARQESQARVETAVHELETLADEDVLMVPETHMAEYTEALRRFEALPRSASQRLLEEAFV